MMKTVAAHHGVATAMGAVVAACVAMVIGGCGAKVQTVDKSLVYQGKIYNMSHVRVVSSKMEVTLPGGDVIDVKGADKKRINALLDEHSTLDVTSTVVMDDTELEYEARRIGKHSEFSRMSKNLDSAMGDIQKFIGDKKKRQLEL